MQVSEAWLRELVNPPIDTAQLVAQLTMAGLEVDAVTPVAADFSGVVVGEVLETVQHPNADKLRVCQVNVGQEQPLQIVCGASNVRPGLKVPAALIGAVLPGDFKIKESKLRGELSFGMLCSEKELGLAATSEGLMELPIDAPVGRDIRDYLLLSDNVIELGLTPNRADCLSVVGVAREVAVLNGLTLPADDSVVIEPQHQQTLEVQVHSAEACPVYLGRLIKGIDPAAQTPLWMQERLRRSGIRSLSPVVDVTNYVLIELGQPLHAFDADKLAAPIVVRRSRPGELLALLNDQAIELDGEALVIADQQQALALAGVMGGKDSAVFGETCDIFLECAFFTPINIAGKARQFGLHTDSSHRFERGVDFNLQRRAIERATQLILEIAGGSPGPVTEVINTEALPIRSAVKLRSARIEKMLGIQRSDAQVHELFGGLGMQVVSCEDGWEITPPGFRFDIAIEEDLLEEIGRVYGYNNLPSSSLLMRSELGKAPESVLVLDRLQDCLVDRGYQQAITYSFVDEAMQNAVAPGDEFIRIRNPISSELAVMRTTLWCGLLNAALYNINRQQSRVRLFETGLRFYYEGGEIQQRKTLAGLALGNLHAEQWGEKSRKVDFFDAKADVEALLAFTATKMRFESSQHPALHPGQTARILNARGEAIGLLGMLHPTLQKQLGFDSPVFLFELDQDAILQHKVPKFTPLSKFPSVRRDMALLVAEEVSADAILGCISECGEQAIRDVSIFDIYRGQGVAAGSKSVALSLVLQDFAQTLTDTEIDAIFRRVLETLTAKLNAKLRE
ncbi:phenylalanine--tRNA ligase subunit beta [Methylomonas sp. SURF-1]|uniref:Phenylalanine--tRNA ligase beta subunit n=1 Tax=Methylomonas aurea TaxID=2952224 RepID=A0ABT1UKC1_9GAMM|nr:phenylalanine--tRNA ligase subunit beta [Methylomonas sp. SURF-1]MCQ8182283.1 phenylalanine--tRNA ligase subunit beta [Methylomonas sp. SURF-1]